jgi:hypothetical protein
MILLALLFIKHWICDFVIQTDAEIRNKGEYGNIDGVVHSAKHGLGTALVLLLFAFDPLTIFSLSILDFIFHYHIDWVKMNYGCQDARDPKFWHHLGLDQLAHSLTYIALVSI